MVKPTGAMRIEHYVLPLRKIGENVFNKGDVVFETTTPMMFKPSTVVVGSDITYPRWYSWLGVLRWFVFPWVWPVKVTVNWKTHRVLTAWWVWPFRSLQRWLMLRHKHRLLGDVLIHSVCVNEREGLPVAIPLLSVMGDTTVYLNMAPVPRGTTVKVVLRGRVVPQGAYAPIERVVPEISLCVVGFTIEEAKIDERW